MNTLAAVLMIGGGVLAIVSCAFVLYLEKILIPRAIQKGYADKPKSLPIKNGYLEFKKDAQLN